MILRNIGRLAAVTMMAALLGGCETVGGWFGSGEGAPLPGDRIAIMLSDRQVDPDPGLASVSVALPRPYANTAWPTPGGDPAHALHHPDLGDSLGRAWTARIGTGSSWDARILGEPVVAGGRVFALDARNDVVALDAANGRVVWRQALEEGSERSGRIGGGVTVSGGRVYAATAFAQVVALDAADGSVQWRTRLPAPSRAAPAVSDGRVFAVTIDNQLEALDAASGERLWSHAGIAEVAGLLGGATPAVTGGVVTVGYSSGELVALRAENGRVLWSDTLAPLRRVDAVSSLAHIRGRTVIDRDLVFAVGHSGRTVAIELRSGQRIWEVPVGGTQQPWVAGDWIFLVTNEAQLVALSRADGRVKWTNALPQFRNEERRRDPIVWAGPVLAGDRLILLGSEGQAITVSPYTGEQIGTLDVRGAMRVAPVVAERTLYILTDGGELIAFR